MVTCCLRARYDAIVVLIRLSNGANLFLIMGGFSSEGDQIVMLRQSSRMALCGTVPPFIETGVLPLGFFRSRKTKIQKATEHEYVLDFYKCEEK